MRALLQWRMWTIVFLYACACLQFVRFYVKSSTFYLYMPAYLTGHERLPFQERVLPILIMRPMFHSARFMHLFQHDQSAVSVTSGPFYALSLFGLFAAAIFTQLLYSKVSQRLTLAPLVFPLFLFCVMWTYCIHNEANYSYPYDFLGLAFFTAGLYCIYVRQFWPLLLIMFVGTLNRETTLFLVGIYILDSASISTETGAPGLSENKGWLARHGLRLASVPWVRVGVLLTVWALVKITLVYYFRHNDRSEDFPRFGYNLARLKIRLVPALLNMCGYLLPVALLFWKRIRPARFGSYILILVVWIPIMVHSGVLLETRIYGEMCSWTAIALTLLIEGRGRDELSGPAECPTT